MGYARGLFKAPAKNITLYCDSFALVEPMAAGEGIIR